MLLKYEGQPITHQLLISLLKSYNRPNDKIKALKNDGVLESLKRGVYIPGRTTNILRPEPGLVANHLYGPSYVSMDSALAYYSLIPERVYGLTSMTTKPSKEFKTAIGLYTYTHLPLPYYAFGLRIVKLNKDQQAIIASPEKALVDKVVTTSGILLRSMSSARDYVIENLRMEESELKSFDTQMMSTWLANAPKRESLEILIKMIEKL